MKNVSLSQAGSNEGSYNATESLVTKVPLCQFGPGGDFVTTYPADGRPIPSVHDAAISQAESRRLRRPLPGRRSRPRVWVTALHSLAAKVARAVRMGGRRDELIAEGMAPLETVAIPAELSAGRVTRQADTELTLAAAMENEHGDTHTQTIRDSAVHSRLSQPAGLFPDDAGNWGPSEPYEGNRVRTRRGTRKKRPADSGRKAQGALFAGLG